MNWKFSHNATEKTIDGKRHYSINGKKYVSVTTMLSATADKSFLVEWKKRVGETEAKRIVKESCNKGTALHKEVELYLKDGQEGTSVHYKQIAPLLANIKPICFEETLYSDVLGVAGRVDCIGYYKDVLSIIDFKTSRTMKRREWITDYFLQCTSYSLCIEDMFGDQVPQIVVLMVTEDERKEFIENRSSYIPILAERLKVYRLLQQNR
jgi:genome maintenance exonuclease 1